ncbi:hypothetical protein EXIGLDRAFT_631507 [Exidia glandulosa HHB12029]|nr:hypothetical protein EXIGLDRAFT_631507 [Exidia glandulosa HHB12029]
MQAGPSHAVPVYFYQDPVTGNRVTTFLPPDHPEMVCLMNGHISKTRFGLLGVLAAIFWFPLGVGLCLVDRHVKCTRCNRILEDGITCG